MWRSFFLAIGAYCCLLGVESLAIEKAVLKVDANIAIHLARSGLRPSGRPGACWPAAPS